MPLGDPLSIREKPFESDVGVLWLKWTPLRLPDRMGTTPFSTKIFWETIKDDLVPFIQLPFLNLEAPRIINETSISTIPKREDPSSITQLLSISFCNTVYKIIAKIIANRLRVSLPKIISSNQNSFLSGRGTKTNVIIANEILYSMRYER